MPASPASLWKQVLFVFFVVLLVYSVFFALDQHLRHRKGPWVVDFRTDSQGRPSMSISQTTLNISNVSLTFPGDSLAATNLESTIAFASPPISLPFGELVFFDTTYLPGALTFHLFGHEVELLPRVLVVNKKELEWKSATRLELHPGDRISGLPRPKSKQTRGQ